MTEHYFSEKPGSNADLREISLVLNGVERTLVTSGGVFSPDHLDTGTAVLLRTLDAVEFADGDILDLGCGWGPIALSVAQRNPHAVVWAVDINERARDLTALNAERLGLKNVRVSAPDAVDPTLTYSAIVSNPPIRVGKETLHEMLRTWLPKLSAGAAAHLVVAKHLGADSLQKWIASEFSDLHVERVARDKGFHVIRASR